MVQNFERLGVQHHFDQMTPRIKPQDLQITKRAALRDLRWDGGNGAHVPWT